MTQPTVIVVEDDQAVSDSLVWMLRQSGFQVEAHGSPASLLAAYDPSKPGCLVLDLRLPEMTGLELHDRLLERGCEHPFIMISGHGEVPTATRAMRMGAIDFIEKPLQRDIFLDRVREAIGKDAEHRQHTAHLASIKSRLESLTPRELEVLERVVTGRLTKQIADELGISVKTVEVHRSNITRKMNVDSVVQLVRLWSEIQSHFQ